MNSLAGAVEMAAPVRDDAIAALGSITASPIADDGVIRNAGRDRDFIDRHDETVIWGQRVDAVRKALQLQSRRIGHVALSRHGPGRSTAACSAFSPASIRSGRSSCLARSLPRCGVDMKITRPISGRCLKMSASSRRRLLSAGISVCSGGFPKTSIQSLFPVSVIRVRLMHPPMLCPTSTIFLRSGYFFSMASSSWRRMSAL